LFTKLKNAVLTLQNQELIATIHPNGAELQSLTRKQNGINYLWSAGPEWPKHSPVLFPIVGTLKQNTYHYGGKSYQLPRHGFARDAEFAFEQISDSEALFTLTESEQSLISYPFRFRLSLRYTLHECTLVCAYEVHNPHAVETLWFSLGAHPAFAVPLLPHQAYTDYHLQFNRVEALHRHKLVEGLIGPDTAVVPAPEGKLALSPQLFYDDAIVLKHLESNAITLGSTNAPEGLHFRFEGFPFFGIWAAKNAPFVCLEPWCGIADDSSHNQVLEQKEGINALAPGQNWQRQWQVQPF
jgi:galactose mutarotase-like enzyme